MDGIGKFKVDDPNWEEGMDGEGKFYLPYDTGIPAWLPKDKDFTERFTDIEISSGFSDRILQQIEDGISF